MVWIPMTLLCCSIVYEGCCPWLVQSDDIVFFLVFFAGYCFCTIFVKQGGELFTKFPAL